MGLLKEAREHGLSIDDLPPKIHCTMFEDNSGALELAQLPKIRPRTKHINLTEFRQPIQVQSHLEMPGILVQLGHIQCT